MPPELESSLKQSRILVLRLRPRPTLLCLARPFSCRDESRVTWRPQSDPFPARLSARARPLRNQQRTSELSDHRLSDHRGLPPRSALHSGPSGCRFLGACAAQRCFNWNKPRRRPLGAASRADASAGFGPPLGVRRPDGTNGNAPPTAPLPFVNVDLARQIDLVRRGDRFTRRAPVQPRLLGPILRRVPPHRPELRLSSCEAQEEMARRRPVA